METSNNKTLEEVKVILKHSTSYQDFLNKIDLNKIKKSEDKK